MAKYRVEYWKHGDQGLRSDQSEEITADGYDFDNKAGIATFFVNEEGGAKRNVRTITKVKDVREV